MSFAGPQKQKCKPLGRKSSVQEMEHPFPCGKSEIHPVFPGLNGFQGLTIRLV
jgi:hypothetical protein